MEETSVGCTYSQSYQDGGNRKFCKRIDAIEEVYQQKNDGLIMKRLSSLEDLVWKLYEELDSKIQDIFDEHTQKFKQQNDIITNIFHGFGQEISYIKEDVQLNSQKLVDGLMSPKLYSEGKQFETESESVPHVSIEDDQKCNKISK